MQETTNSRRPLLLASLFCFIALIPSLLAWLVNLELALRAIFSSWCLFEYIIPAALYRRMIPLAADFSTVTTLVPVLVFYFPFVQGLRVVINISRGKKPGEDLSWLPYPDKFSFFLVMLGLTGTLYGLLIGLGVSGVGAITEVGNKADNISAALENLLDGTATALLSSLAGLMGAFLAAEPVTWIFRKLACIEAAEEEGGLAETLEMLTRDLRELGNASRDARKLLEPGAEGNMFGVLENLDKTITSILGRIDNVPARLEQIQTVHERNSGFLKRLESIDTATSTFRESICSVATILEKIDSDYHSIKAHLESIDMCAKSVNSGMDGFSRNLHAINSGSEKTNQLLERLVKSTEMHNSDIVKGLGELVSAVTDNNNAARKEREALRKVFALYGSGRDL